MESQCFRKHNQGTDREEACRPEVATQHQLAAHSGIANTELFHTMCSCSGCTQDQCMLCGRSSHYSRWPGQTDPSLTLSQIPSRGRPQEHSVEPGSDSRASTTHGRVRLTNSPPQGTPAQQPHRASALHPDPDHRQTWASSQHAVPWPLHLSSSVFADSATSRSNVRCSTHQPRLRSPDDADLAGYRPFSRDEPVAEDASHYLEERCQRRQEMLEHLHRQRAGEVVHRRRPRLAHRRSAVPEWRSPMVNANASPCIDNAGGHALGADGFDRVVARAGLAPDRRRAWVVDRDPSGHRRPVPSTTTSMSSRRNSEATSADMTRVPSPHVERGASRRGALREPNSRNT